MRPGRERRVLLPPRPRLRDWPCAGAAAGALLGAGEFAVGWASGRPLPPPLGLAIAGADAAIVALACGAAGGVARARGRRVSHSGLVGAALGAQASAPVVAGLASWTGPAPGLLPVLLLAAGLAVAGVAGLLGARLGDRVERGGMPLSGPAVWAAAGLALASAERILAGGLAPVTTGLLVAVPPAVALVALGGFALVRRRGTRARASFQRSLVGVLAAVALASYTPWWLPWLLYDQGLPALGNGPPNALVVVSASDGLEGATSFAGLASAGGVVFERLAPEPPGGARSLLTLPDGEPLLERLRGSGFAAATVAMDPSLAPARGEVDARPGPQGLLARSGGWTAGAPVLLGPGVGLLAALDLDAELRAPERVAADARRWLLRWRTTRAPAPFFLVVDLRASTRPPPAEEAVDAALESLLREIEHLGVADRTWVVVVADDAPAGVARPPRRVVVRRPGTWLRPPPPRRVEDPVPPSALALALLRSTTSDAKPALPGDGS